MCARTGVVSAGRRFAGGIVSADAAEPKNEWRGAAAVRVFDAGGVVEAPFANGRGNVMVGGRYSYSAAASSIFSPGLDIGYWDCQVRAAYDVTPDDRFSVLAFGALDFASEEDLGVTRPICDVSFHRTDVRYDHRFSATRRLRLAAATGRERTLAIDRGGVANGSNFDITARPYGARAEHVDRLAENVELRAGADVISEKSASAPASSSIAVSPRRSVTPTRRSPPRELAPFYRIDWQLEKRWPFGEHRYLSLIFEFLNTTLSREVLRASCTAIYCTEDVFGPVSVPSIGVEAAF